MDIEKLKKEIVSCRGAVRKARVAVIRKIIKKMKILKTCKLESVKEKKLRKSERLFEKVQIIKKLKDDDITIFALRNKDLEAFLKGPNLDLKQNALASLGKHDAVVSKVNSIKEQFSDWEKELPILLDSIKEIKTEVVNNKKDSFKTVMTKKSKGENVKIKPALKRPKQEFGKGKSDDVKKEHSEVKTENSVTSEKIEKIEDPFFIEKKVIPPKLSVESLPSNTNDEIHFPKKFPLKKDIRGIYGKPFKTKTEFGKIKRQKPVPVPVPVVEEEKLHPSWAAKKVQLIKPFEGKKIMFSDD